MKLSIIFECILDYIMSLIKTNKFKIEVAFDKNELEWFSNGLYGTTPKKQHKA